MSEELKPCPFCGDTPDPVRKINDRRPEYYIDCCNCGLRMWGIEETEVVGDWNARSESEEIEILHNIIDKMKNCGNCRNNFSWFGMLSCMDCIRRYGKTDDKWEMLK